MTTDRSPRRLPAVLARVLLALPVVVVAVLGLGAAPASAHAGLSSTSPTQGSQLAAAPTEVSLVFTEEIGVSTRSVQVSDARGRRVDDGRPQHTGGDSRTVRVGLTPGLAKGSYTVTWRVVSVDGHPVSGTFAFGVGVPAGTVEQDSAVDPLVGGLRTATQLLGYAGAALLIGGSAFLFLLWPTGGSSPRLRRLMIGGVVVAAVGSVGALLVQGPYVAGRSLDGLFDGDLLTETLGSSYGRPLLLRVLAVALAVPVLGIWPPMPEGEDVGPGGVAAIGNAVLLAASFSLTGHAAEATPRLLAEAADGVHLAAAGIWLGGLAVLLFAYLPAAAGVRAGAGGGAGARVGVGVGAAGGPGAGDGSGGAGGTAVAERTDAGDVPDVLARWSRIAMASVGLLVVTGAYQAWRETGALDVLTGTTYGRLLIVKVSVVVGLLVVASVARSAVARTARGEPVLGRLRATVGIEALLGVAVLVVTSLLVATPPARTSYGPPFSASVQGKDAEGTPIRVVVDVAPTKVGPQTVRLHTYTPTGEVLPFSAATGLLKLEGGDAPVQLSFTPITDGEGVATGVVVPAAGRWTLTVQVLTEGTTDYAATTTYTVR